MKLKYVELWRVHTEESNPGLVRGFWLGVLFCVLMYFTLRVGM